MARLPYLDPDQAEPRVAELLGKMPDLGIFRMVANAQGAFRAWLRFGGAMLDPNEFDPLLRELAIMRVAALTPGADYEWVQHAQITLDVGGTEEQLEAIKRGELDAAVLGADGQLESASRARWCATRHPTRRPSRRCAHASPRARSCTCCW